MSLNAFLEQNKNKKVKVAQVVLNNKEALEGVRLIEARGQSITSDLVVNIIQDQIIPPNDPVVSLEQQELATFAQRTTANYVYGEGMASHLLAKTGVVKESVIVGTDPDIMMLGALGVITLCVDGDKLAEVLATGEVDLPPLTTYTVKLERTGIESAEIHELAIALVKQLEHKVTADKVLVLTGINAVLSEEECLILSGWLQRTGAFTVVCVDNCVEFDEVFDVSVDKVKAPRVDSHQSNDKKVTAVFIGGSYGGFLSDIKIVAEALNDKHVAYGMRLTVSPATADIYVEAANKGYLNTIIRAGGMVINQCGSPEVQARIGEKEIMVSNNNRDEVGYAGPTNSYVFLTSTNEAVEVAITGILRGGAK